MAINLVTPPTSGAPVSTDDYDAQNNILQAQIYNISCGNRYLTEWDTLTEPEIADGVYIQHGGALYLVDGDEAISGAPSDERVYIKLTESAGVITAEFVNSAAGYSWNDIYNGFYHADGTQLLPVILYLYTSGYLKFHSSRLEDCFDITSRIKIHEISEIGVWDMDATQLVQIPFGDLFEYIALLDDYARGERTISLFATINPDDNENCSILNCGASSATGGGNIVMSMIGAAYNYNLIRVNGGVYDNIAYDDGTMNRGFLHHEYWI